MNTEDLQKRRSNEYPVLKAKEAESLKENRRCANMHDMLFMLILVFLKKIYIDAMRCNFVGTTCTKA